jgi:hypothetical protein
VLFLVILARYRASVIKPLMPRPAFIITDNSEIEPMTNKHEWKSVSFMRQSRSLHYGRFMLSEGPPLIIHAIIRRVPLQEALRRIGFLYLDREGVVRNRLIMENPFYRELTQDDFKYVRLIQQKHSPIQIESEGFKSSFEDDE